MCILSILKWFHTLYAILYSMLFSFLIMVFEEISGHNENRALALFSLEYRYAIIYLPNTLLLEA